MNANRANPIGDLLTNFPRSLLVSSRLATLHSFSFSMKGTTNRSLKIHLFCILWTCLIPEMSAILRLNPVCTWPLVRGNASSRKTTLFWGYRCEYCVVVQPVLNLKDLCVYKHTLAPSKPQENVSVHWREEGTIKSSVRPFSHH